MTRRSILLAGLFGVAALAALVTLTNAPADAWRGAVTFTQFQQQEMQERLATTLRAIKEQGMAAAAGLVAVSFLYGVIHAAGPGHGKAVITAYVLADSRQLRSGLVLAWVSSLFQAVTAIMLVAAVVYVAGAATRDAQPMALLLERIGYGLIVAVGLWMIWTAIRRALAASEDRGHASAPHAHDGHDHHHHGHVHAFSPEESASWRRAAAVVLSVGIRPCSGALLVLAFSRALGLFGAGIAATFAMAVGTAVTVSLLATLAFGSRQLALRLAGDESRWLRRINVGIGLLGGAALLLLGTLMLAASLQQPPAPFR